MSVWLLFVLVCSSLGLACLGVSVLPGLGWLFPFHVRESKKVKVKSLSCIRLFTTPWTVAYQSPPPMGLSREGYWSVLPFPSPGNLPDSGIESRSPTLWADTLPSETPGKLQLLSLLSSPSGIPLMQMLVCLMLSLGSFFSCCIHTRYLGKRHMVRDQNNTLYSYHLLPYK